MKNIIALIVLTSMLFALLCGCAKNKKDDGKDDDVPTNNGTDTDNGGNETTTATIVIPEYKDYQRGSKNFSEIVYSRPNIESILNAFEAATAAITANEKTADEQIQWKACIRWHKYTAIRIRR